MRIKIRDGREWQLVEISNSKTDLQTKWLMHTEGRSLHGFMTLPLDDPLPENWGPRLWPQAVLPGRPMVSQETVDSVAAREHIVRLMDAAGVTSNRTGRDVAQVLATALSSRS